MKYMQYSPPNVNVVPTPMACSITHQWLTHADTHSLNTTILFITHTHYKQLQPTMYMYIVDEHSIVLTSVPLIPLSLYIT